MFYSVEFEFESDIEFEDSQQLDLIGEAIPASTSHHM